MKNKNRRGGGSFRGGRPSFQMGGQYAPRAVGRGEYNPGIQNPRQEAYQGRMQAMRFQAASSDSNADAAVALRAMLQSSVMPRFFVSLSNLIVYLIHSLSARIYDINYRIAC